MPTLAAVGRSTPVKTVNSQNARTVGNLATLPEQEGATRVPVQTC